jgi:hypothetical protein
LINFQSGPTVVTWHAFIGPSDVARLISSLLHGPLCLLTRRERNKGREEAENGRGDRRIAEVQHRRLLSAAVAQRTACQARQADSSHGGGRPVTLGRRPVAPFPVPHDFLLPSPPSTAPAPAVTGPDPRHRSMCPVRRGHRQVVVHAHERQPLPVSNARRRRRAPLVMPSSRRQCLRRRRRVVEAPWSTVRTWNVVATTIAAKARG